MTKIKIYIALCGMLMVASCKESVEDTEPTTQEIPEFYLTADKNEPLLREVFGISDGILEPRDLDFKPGTSELWVMNQGNWGSDFVIIQDLGGPDQIILKRKDSHSSHFVNNGSALAFSEINTFATSPEIKNTVGDTNSLFMGPALWSGDLDVFAMVYQSNWDPNKPLGSHYDMLHQSPYSMGIAHKVKNQFYILDGWNRTLCLYDFVDDHGPGADYHSDGKVYRYLDVKFTRYPNIPSHIIVDEETGNVFYSNTYDGELIMVDPSTSAFYADLTPKYEVLNTYQARTNAKVTVLAKNLIRPCGIDMKGNRVFVGDYETGNIHVYNKNTGEQIAVFETGIKGFTGLKIGPDGHIWIANYLTSKIYEIVPQ